VIPRRLPLLACFYGQNILTFESRLVLRRPRNADARLLGRHSEADGADRLSSEPVALRATPLKVRGVRVDDRAYVLCLNDDEATKDRHDREAIVAALRDALRNGDTSLVGNKGYRRYLKSTGHRFDVDEAKIAADARFDGKWVLTTNTGLDPRATALAYKQLWMVESIFRSMKSVLETRPVYHTCDDTIRGHVFCSFLALVLRKALEDQLAARRWKLEWNDIIQDLDRLEDTAITVDGKGYVIRTDPKGTVGKVFQASGAAMPTVVRPC